MIHHNALLVLLMPRFLYLFFSLGLKNILKHAHLYNTEFIPVDCDFSLDAAAAILTKTNLTNIIKH